MKIILENVINEGRYDLSDMIKKIETVWVQGDISEEDKNSLIELARKKANPEYSYAPLKEQIEQALEKILALEKSFESLTKTVEALKETVKELGSEVEILDIDPIEYPEYIQPTGAHDAYHNGDKVTFEGKHYKCIAPDGAPCVWSPSEYPAYWEEVV